MRLIFKHLRRSIGKKPLQPIILVLTIALAISTSIFAFTVGDTLYDDVQSSQLAKYGNAEFTVSVGNSSDSRFLFIDDVESLLDERANVAGCYELPMILNGSDKTVVGMATEFDSVCKVFFFEFVEYGTVSEGTLGDVAFISTKLAEEMNLSVGDSLEVETMGHTKTYRIEGIAKQNFLGSYDVLVDISSVMRIFADNSLVFAAIGDDFKPCSKIYVDLDNCENVSVEDAIALLSADARFADKTFTDLRGIEGRRIRSGVIELIVDFAIALAVLLSAVITFCCFYILANERAEENLILSYSGASFRRLAALQYTETLLYWLFGAPLGILGAIPLTRIISHFVDLKYAEVMIKPINAMLSALIVLLGCSLTVTFFLFTNKRMRRTGEKHKKANLCIPVVLLLVLALLFGAMYLLTPVIRFGLYVATLIVLVACIFLVIPHLLRCLGAVASKRIKGRLKPSAIAFRYALKNVCSLKLFQNITRLVALIVGLVLTIALVFICLQGHISLIENAYEADYAVLNATDSCYEKLLSCEEAESVYRFYLTQTDLTTIVSADDVSAFSESFAIDRMPIGNEAIINKGMAHMLDLKIGEIFSISLDGQEYELVVADIEKSGMNYIAINCEDLGIPYNMILVKGRETVSQADLIGALSEATSTELAAIVSVESLLENLIDSMGVYTSAGKILLFIFVVFSLIGVIDALYESARARREEFGLYCFAGMSQRTLKRLKRSEIAIAIVFGIVIGIVAFVISAFAANRGFTGRGMELFSGLFEVLK